MVSGPAISWRGMTSTPQAPADPGPDNSLANRYGRYQSSRPSFSARWGQWIGAGAIAVAVALAVWSTAATNTQTLDWKDVGYNIKSPTQASVKFQLAKDYEDTVECAIQVLSENYAVVGWRGGSSRTWPTGWANAVLTGTATTSVRPSPT